MSRDELIERIRALGCTAVARDFEVDKTILVTHEDYADRSGAITVYSPSRYFFVYEDRVEIGFDPRHADVVFRTTEEVIEHLRETFPLLR